MATPDYDPNNVITPPPGKTPNGPGENVDLIGDDTGIGGNVGTGGNPAGAGGNNQTYQNRYGGDPTGGSIAGAQYGDYTPADVQTGVYHTGQGIPDVQAPDIKPDYSRIPTFSLPDVEDEYKVKAVPQITLDSKQDLIPGGDTQLLTKDTPGYDWEAIAGKAPGVTPEQTVQGQLQELFKEGSPLLEYAKGLGMQYANSRGLINSDIGAQAGSMAVFNQAVPIAAQDANTYAARAQQEAGFWQAAGLQAQQATIASALQAQDHLETMREMALQGDINAQLQLEQFGYNWRLSEQQNIHRMAQQAWQGKIDAKLNLQKLGIDAEKLRIDYGYRVFMQNQDAKNEWTLNNQTHNQALDRMAQDQVYTLQQIDRNSMRRIDEINAQGTVESQLTNQRARIDANARDQQADIDAAARQQQGDIDSRLINEEYDRRDQMAEDDARRQEEEDERRFALDLQNRYLDQTGARTTQYSQEVQAIYSTPGLTYSQQQNAIRIATDNYIKDMDFITRQFSSNPHWDPAWEVDPIGVPSGGGTGTTVTDRGGTGSTGGIQNDPGTQPTSPANPNGVSGGSSNGSLDGASIEDRNAWEASGYDYQGKDQSGQYDIAYSAGGRLVVYHPRLKKWVDPNNHQYRNDFPGLSVRQPGQSDEEYYYDRNTRFNDNIWDGGGNYSDTDRYGNYVGG